MIIYGMVSKMNHLIADYSSKQGDFEQIALKIIQKVPATNQKKSYNQSGYQFTFFSQDEHQFLCMSESDAEKEHIFQFLDDLSQNFNQILLAQGQSSLCQKVAQCIKELMNKIENVKNKDIMSKTEKELSIVQDMARSNIDKMVEKGVKLDVLIDKTTDIKKSAEMMQYKSKKVRNDMIRQRYLFKGMALVFIIFVITYIYFYKF